jgi:predicted RNase H-like nuclease (RuvC/YqgF family)
MNKVVRIEMKGERDRIKELEKEKRELETALARSQLKILTLESLIESVEEHYKIDTKKNIGIEGLKRLSNGEKAEGGDTV